MTGVSFAESKVSVPTLINQLAGVCPLAVRLRPAHCHQGVPLAALEAVATASCDLAGIALVESLMDSG